jgi:hypothetical protein
MKTYTLLRRLHLTCAFVLMAFVVMYFVTGYVLTHGDWFGQATVDKQERTVVLDSGRLGAQPDEAGFAAALQEQTGIRGQRSPGRREGDRSWRFQYFRPGHLATVMVSPDLRSAQVTEQHLGWQRILIGFHRLHGYGGGWLYDLWAVLYDLASLSMIVFAVTGVWLWFRLAGRYWPGLVILGAGLALTLATAGYLLLAP